MRHSSMLKQPWWQQSLHIEIFWCLTVFFYFLLLEIYTNITIMGFMNKYLFPQILKTSKLYQHESGDLPYHGSFTPSQANII